MMLTFTQSLRPIMYIDSYYFGSYILLQRWFVDGTVNCFEGGHLPLAILAIVILTFYILVVSFIIAVVLKKIKVRTSICTHIFAIMLLCDRMYL